MGLEAATFINSLVATNPAGTDPKSTADDHLRLIKSAIKSTFPAITGAVSATHAEINHLAGVTSAVQTQLGTKANLASPALTGTPTAPTAAASTNNTQIASTAYVQGEVATVNAAKANLASPALTGIPTAPTAVLSTNTTQIATTAFTQAAVASINSQLALVVAVVTGTTQTAVTGSHYVLTNVAATTITLPAGVSGNTVAVTSTGSLDSNVITPNGAETIMGTAGSMTIDKVGATVTLRYLNGSWRLI